MASVLSESSVMSERDDLTEDVSQFEHVRRKHVGRYVSAVLIVALASWVVMAFAHGRIEWAFVGQYLAVHSIIAGLGNTVLMTALAMLLGSSLGVPVAIMRLSANPVINWAAAAYVWLFRGTPVLLQLLLWFNLALVFPNLGIPGL